MIFRMLLLYSSQLPDQISVTGELISGATATGVLVAVYSITNPKDIHYIVKPAKEGDLHLHGCDWYNWS